MRKIVAIGGGNLLQKETFLIDQHIVQLTGKRQPTILFIPTASNDDADYIEGFTNTYQSLLNCRVDCLLMMHDAPDYEEMKNKILSADAIYVGGGNTLMMMRKWRFYNVPSLLLQALQQGTILSGISAGALCWFAYGHSDSMSYYQAPSHHTAWNYIRVKCLGYVDRITISTHYQSPNGASSFKNMLHKTGGIGIALEDNSAIAILNDQFRILRSQNDAKVYKLIKQRAKVLIKELPVTDHWIDMSYLLSKNV